MATLDLGGGYSIDLADADRFVNALNDALERLARTYRTTARELRVRPPGNDDYSAVVANAYTDVSEQHNVWNLQKQRELKEMINRVSAAVASYQQVEHNNTMKG